MEHTSIDSELSAVAAALRSHPTPQITGGQLYKLMRQAAPALNYRQVVAIPRGPGAMTQFVEAHLTNSLKKIGNQGGDILYEILDHVPVGFGQDARELWSTFVAPLSTMHVVLKLSGEGLVCRRTPANEREDEREIEKATAAELDIFRQAFMDSLPLPEAEAVSAKAPISDAYSVWLPALREHLPDMVRKWGAFRRERLARLFVGRIEDLDVDGSIKAKAFEQIKAAERSVYDRPTKTRSAKVAEVASDQNPSVIGLAGSDDNVGEARSLARIAIESMGYDELRSLRLPLGVILDALRTK